MFDSSLYMIEKSQLRIYYKKKIFQKKIKKILKKFKNMFNYNLKEENNQNININNSNYKMIKNINKQY